MPTRGCCYFVLLGTCTTTRSPSLKPTPALISRHDADQTVPFTRRARPRASSLRAAERWHNGGGEGGEGRSHRVCRASSHRQGCLLPSTCALRTRSAAATLSRPCPTSPHTCTAAATVITVSGCSSCAVTSNRVACSHRTATRYAAAAHLAISLVNLLRCLMPNEKARD
eukprot:COSAG01_NODE_123_length_25210_cov_348.799434_13_plen_169_part_00